MIPTESGGIVAYNPRITIEGSLTKGVNLRSSDEVIRHLKLQSRVP
jgi:hypothetical protein